MWKRIVAVLARLDAREPETTLASNLLTGLFGAGQLATEADVDGTLATWREAHERLRAAS